MHYLETDYMSICSYVKEELREREKSPRAPCGTGGRLCGDAYANSISPVAASIDFTTASDST